MAACPFCNAEFRGYSIVGVQVANQHLTHWQETVPVAQLCCDQCGRYTFMHPDHPDVQRMRKSPPVEETAENVRTLNVDLREVGDPDLREQFERGKER